ncbi:hypothetical protein [Cellulosimicrobium sp. TH-20]|uniref:hypothetical protein n=1 Tax=Cellulosimicrobium sp. TH-20 TaxID=1980001 RepID=UPI00119D3C45|nr:hypothetical protein [Cellulosimicrobium sp. TH-20]
MTHPSRAERAYRLRAAHPDLDLQVVVDPEPDGPPTAWRTARAAWAAVPSRATHHLVVQDDVLLAAGTRDWLLGAIRARPHEALCLFVEWGARTAHAVRVAALLGQGWTAVVDDYVPCVALVLPAEVARGYDAYALAETSPDTPDDVVLRKYLARAEMTAVAPTRGPVEHDTDTSLVGNSVMGLRRAVSFGGDDAPAPSSPCLPALDQVPYYDWWDQQAALFIPDATTEDGWARLRGGPALARFGMTPARLSDECGRLLRALAGAPRLLDVVSRILVDEIYFVSFLVGAIARSTGPVVPFPGDPVATAALATLPHGALRRVLPAHRLDEVAELLGPVVEAGVRHGVRHVVERPARTG